MNKKVIIPLLVLAVIAVLAGGGILVWSMRPGMAPTEVTPTPTISPELTSAPKPTVPAEEEETMSDLEQIRILFSEKYDKPLGDVELSISKNTGTYATGGVKFAGEISGAMWLACNDGEGWIIVHDGQGTIPCESVDPYDFPNSMVPECWDEATSKLITR
jgi:hypothetical protein